MKRENIERFLTEVGVTKFRSTDSRVLCSCPAASWLHDKGSDRHPSMSIKVVKDGPSPYYCFACKLKGRSLKSLVWQLRRSGLGTPELGEWVKEQESVDVGDAARRENEALNGDDYLETVKVRKKLVWNEKEIEPFKGKVPKYALNRGLTLETCKEWGLGYDEAEGRLIFPVRNREGELVGVVGRAIDDNNDTPYKNYLHFPKSDYLFGEHMVDPDLPDWVTDHLPGGNAIVLVEGMVDVIWMFQAGYRMTLGMFGTSLSEAQAIKVRDYGRPIYLMTDWDKEGKRSKELIIGTLKGLVQLFDVEGPDGKDPAELAPEEIQRLMGEARLVI